MGVQSWPLAPVLPRTCPGPGAAETQPLGSVSGEPLLEEAPGKFRARVRSGGRERAGEE